MTNQNLAKYANFGNNDMIALFVAALCHDVGHDGFNNNYHKVTKSAIN